MNVLTNPPFAADPPLKWNINARILGLVIGILAALGALLGLISLFTIFGFCSGLYGCGFPVIWLFGSVVGLAGEVLAAIGGFRMYNRDREGKDLVIYGIVLAVVGSFINLIGSVLAYSGLGIAFGGAAVFGFIVGLAIDVLIYYLVVISRFPHEQPLGPPGHWGGSTPPGPPPPPPPL